MISERRPSVTITNGTKSKSYVNVTQNNTNKIAHKHYKEDEDNYQTVKKERERIINLKPTDCPKDFPWPHEWHWAQYSLTPYQSAFMKIKKNNI